MLSSIHSITKTALYITLLSLVLTFLFPPLSAFVSSVHAGYVSNYGSGVTPDNYVSVEQPNIYGDGKRLASTFIDSGYLLADTLGLTTDLEKEHGQTFNFPYYSYLVEDLDDAEYNIQAYYKLYDPVTMDTKSAEQLKDMKDYIDNISHYAYKPDDFITCGMYTFEDLGVTLEEWKCLAALRKWLLLYNQPDFETVYGFCHYDVSADLSKEKPLKTDILDLIMGWFD